MAVLKQTSPTAWPSAPSPKPSSTVPSASTSSAVGLWSGQAGEFSECVMSALHSRRGGRRQSRNRGFFPADTPGHDDFMSCLVAMELLDQGRHKSEDPPMLRENINNAVKDAMRA